MGCKLPKDSVQIFAKNFISSEQNERDAAFSPNGKEYYYSLMIGQKGCIVYTKLIDSIWTEPEIVNFSGIYSDLEPFINHDGTKLYFASNRPISDTIKTNDYNIWYCNRQNNNWTEPKLVSTELATTENEFYPTVAKNGNLYFCATYPEGFGAEDIYVSKYINGKYQKPVILPEPINTKSYEYNAMISPNEDYIIYNTHGYKGGYGGGDLWISYKFDSIWLKPINLGDKINSEYLDFCPALSPDGKYFLFSSRRNIIPQDKKLTLEEVKNYLHKPENGVGDIYWISSNFIKELKPQ